MLLVGVVGSCLALCSAEWLSFLLLPLKRLCLWPPCSRHLWLGSPTSQLAFHLGIHPPGNLSLLILMSGDTNEASLLKQRCRKELGSECWAPLHLGGFLELLAGLLSQENSWKQCFNNCNEEQWKAWRCLILRPVELLTLLSPNLGTF